jgi:hypothetical protein
MLPATERLGVAESINLENHPIPRANDTHVANSTSVCACAGGEHELLT